MNLPSTVGVTAYLNIQYKAPTMAECVPALVIPLKLEQSVRRRPLAVHQARGPQSVDRGQHLDARRQAARRCQVREYLRDATNRDRALFVEPKMASMLDTTSIKQARPPSSLTVADDSQVLGKSM